MKIAAIGQNCLDHFIVLEDFSCLGNERTITENIHIDGGGQSPTALATATKLGAKTELWSRVGDDHAGLELVQRLKHCKINTDYVEIMPGETTTTAHILVNKQNGERRIFYTGRSTIHEQPLKINFSERLKDVDVALMSSTVWAESSLKMLQEAKKCEVRTVADFDNISAEFHEHIKLIDVLIVSEICALRYINNKDFLATAAKMRELGAEIVIITLGDKGCAVVSQEKSFLFPAFQIQAVDTTGAGDAFHGAFLYCLAQNWDLEKSVEFSSAVAALNCGKLGGRGHLPTLKEVHKFLKEFN